ncbi:MAG: hypothetical protein COB98_08410 [Flavobacteriaceae bacterium]|nr:MAG: hypothetical protein COB98_08410 [Flavobacteriaceae bacterium]
MKIIFTIFITFISIVSWGQADTLRVHYDKGTVLKRSFNTQDLEGFKAQKAFNYEVLIEKHDPTMMERLYIWLKRVAINFLEWIFGVENATGIFAIILRILPYAVAGLVLFLVLRFFMKVNSNGLITTRTNKTIVDFVEAEDLMNKNNIQSFIDKAIADANFRLAIRYHYILMLQRLDASKSIVWEQQKTNVDYIKEIKNREVQSDFKHLTWVYNRIWYGDFEINELDFIKVQQEFQGLTYALKH